MLRKKNLILVSIVLLTIVFNLVTGIMPAMAQGPVYRAPDFEINVYGWPAEMVAGKSFDITVSAGSETVGPASGEEIRFVSSGGGTITAPTNLDATGSLTATVVYTLAGSATLTVAVGIDEVFTYTVQAGDCLQAIAAEHGDCYPEIWERNKNIVGKDPSRLSAGQVLKVVRYAPSRTLETTVLAAKPHRVEWTSPLKVTLGETPRVSGVLQDQYGNPVSGAITVTLGTTLETETIALMAEGEFKIGFTTVYTVAGAISLKVMRADGQLLADLDFMLIPAEPAKLSVSGLTKAIAGSGAIVFGVNVTDQFNYSNYGQVVTMTGQVTSTLGIPDPLAFFDYEVPTQTGRIELVFEAAGLQVIHVLTVTPAATAEITATVREDGSVEVSSYDAYGNVRVGDPVTGTFEVDGLTVTVQTETVAPPELEPAAAPDAPAAVAAPAAPAAPVVAVGGEEYTVQAGDSLWSIWELLGRPAPWQEWKSATMEVNDLTYTGDIVVLGIGQVLTLPGTP